MNMEEKTQKSYTITKKIAKHGASAIIVIPKFLQEDLKPKTVVEVKINVVKEAENE
jgi:antitoxin component of MazEF toxin-antitoxin module